jgi:hypothetical protein
MAFPDIVAVTNYFLFRNDCESGGKTAALQKLQFTGCAVEACRFGRSKKPCTNKPSTAPYSAFACARPETPHPSVSVKPRNAIRHALFHHGFQFSAFSCQLLVKEKDRQSKSAKHRVTPPSVRKLRYAEARGPARGAENLRGSGVLSEARRLLKRSRLADISFQLLVLSCWFRRGIANTNLSKLKSFCVNDAAEPSVLTATGSQKLAGSQMLIAVPDQ